MKFDKLVRDKIPDLIELDGKRAVTRILDEEEYKVYLEKKLDEEVAEFHESKSPSELVDILEVVFALGYAYDFSAMELHRMAENKRLYRGGFRKKILLEEICEEAEDEGLNLS